VEGQGASTKQKGKKDKNGKKEKEEKSRYKAGGFGGVSGITSNVSASREEADARSKRFAGATATDSGAGDGAPKGKPRGLVEAMNDKQEKHLRAEGDYIVGTCEAMCSERERLDREESKNLAAFEIIGLPGETYPPRCDPERAIKKYRRAAAGQSLNSSDVRPPHVLQRTLLYICEQIVDQGQHAFTEMYEFISDRMRAIRQDYVCQNRSDADCIASFETMLRFHIAIVHELGHSADMAEHNPNLNLSKLTQTLTSLIYFYEEAETRGEHPPGEAECQAYRLLFYLYDPTKFTDDICGMPAWVRTSKAVQFAITVHEAISQNNAPRFFKLLKEATYLQACCLLRMVDQVRSHALEVMVAAYQRYPAADLVGALCFEDETHCRDFLERVGIPVEGDEVLFDACRKAGTFTHATIGGKDDPALTFSSICDAMRPKTLCEVILPRGTATFQTHGPPLAAPAREVRPTVAAPISRLVSKKVVEKSKPAQAIKQAIFTEPAVSFGGVRAFGSQTFATLQPKAGSLKPRMNAAAASFVPSGSTAAPSFGSSSAFGSSSSSVSTPFASSSSSAFASPSSSSAFSSVTASKKAPATNSAFLSQASASSSFSSSAAAPSSSSLSPSTSSSSSSSSSAFSSTFSSSTSSFPSPSVPKISTSKTTQKALPVLITDATKPPPSLPSANAPKKRGRAAPSPSFSTISSATAADTSSEAPSNRKKRAPTTIEVKPDIPRSQVPPAAVARLQAVVARRVLGRAFGSWRAINLQGYEAELARLEAARQHHGRWRLMEAWRAWVAAQRASQVVRLQEVQAHNALLFRKEKWFLKWHALWSQRTAKRSRLDWIKSSLFRVGDAPLAAASVFASSADKLQRLGVDSSLVLSSAPSTPRRGRLRTSAMQQIQAKHSSIWASLSLGAVVADTLRRRHPAASCLHFAVAMSVHEPHVAHAYGGSNASGDDASVQPLVPSLISCCPALYLIHKLA
jgi:hypothetical protein